LFRDHPDFSLAIPGLGEVNLFSAGALVLQRDKTVLREETCCMTT